MKETSLKINTVRFITLGNLQKQLTPRSVKSISVRETIPTPPNEVKWLHWHDVIIAVDSLCAVQPSVDHSPMFVLKYPHEDVYTPTDRCTLMVKSMLLSTT